MNGDALLEPHEFHGNLTLVVVHGDHTVIAIGFSNGADKCGVSREGAFCNDALIGCKLDTRCNHANFFITKVAVVAVVGIESAHGQTRLCNASRFQ